MKKLLELKKLEKLLQLKLLGIKRSENIYLCYHSNYDKPRFSIYTDAKSSVHV